ncbi:ParB/Srx family N-terminal domain-containing protein [Kineococcus sp. LSe6-4]|uniref:ParB/Srx family N-terminal domain-containing protein n=1 Tax=Kineococcus halophytocola TaxID=3234027 RepID=A0ABV4GYG8_9ACTN
MPLSPLRPARVLAAAVLALGTGVGLLAPASAAPGRPGERPVFCGHDQRRSPGSENLCAQPGDLLDVRIGDVHPTQPSVGYDQVFYKLGRYTLGKDAVNKKFDDWCEADGRLAAEDVQPGARLDDPSSFTCELPVGAETAESLAAVKTVVVGPRGTLYLTDGHHTLTSFAETPDGGLDLHVRLRVVANLSSLTPPAFWERMQAEGWVYLRDPQGRPVTVNRLPRTVGLATMADDPYRSLVYFSRDIGYEQNGLPFQEFSWGSWIRDSAPVDLSAWDRADRDSYLATVESVTRAMTALPRDAVVDHGSTAAQLGALAVWNDGKGVTKGEFGKLSRPYEDDKPGKLAYATAYREAHGIG